jgi:endoglucanase Acf2
VASRVRTRFTATVETMQGEPVPPLLGLYPHHWFRNASVEARLGPAYDTVRGPIRLLAASSFETVKPFHGFVPWWPAVEGGARQEELRDVMRTDLRNARRMMLEIGNGPYWQGKGLQRIGKLLDVVQVQGDAQDSARLLDLLKGRMEQWFAGGSRKTYFHLDSTIGTVAAYPEEYFSVEQMNDHHFHYGYWIRAAAEVALRDPDWARPERWGGIVDLLVADIATSTRGDARFPYLRTFDAYEGHSWASGVGLGAHGNNQESSSEAINAWAALILWGEVTGRRELRDLGAWLYASEIDAVQHYWFDVHGLVFAPEYRAMRQEASMVFGGKYAHNTWWTDEPRQIKGINLLPVTTASVHLARDPAYVKRSLGALDAEVANWLGRGKRYADVPRDIWQDIFAKVQALVDPAAALTQWNRWGAVELGDSRSHTLHWLLSLQEMGVPDLSVTADTPLHGVFRRPDGRRTYLAFNAGSQPLDVRFSDGTSITVGPRSLGRRSN